MIDSLVAENPKAKEAKPEDFIDSQFVKELNDRGFIDISKTKSRKNLLRAMQEAGDPQEIRVGRCLMQTFRRQDIGEHGEEVARSNFAKQQLEVAVLVAVFEQRLPLIARLMTW